MRDERFSSSNNGAYRPEEAARKTHPVNRPVKGCQLQQPLHSGRLHLRATWPERVRGSLGLTDHPQQLYENGTAFRLSIVDLFEGARRAIAGAGIRILRSELGSEYLIGDAPVVITDASGQRSGVSSGAPIGNSTEIFLPLGPKVAAVFDMTNSQNKYLETPSEVVNRYNTWEVEAAVKEVAMRPESPLEEFPETLRPRAPQ